MREWPALCSGLDKRWSGTGPGASRITSGAFESNQRHRTGHEGVIRS